MNLEQLVETLENGKGLSYLNAVKLATSANFKALNLSYSEDKYFEAFYSEVPNFPDLKPQKPIEPSLENLEKLVFNFAGKDLLRPQFNGVYFDKERKQTCVTDCHKMVVLPTNFGKDGIFKFNRIAKEPTIEKLIECDARYPDYMSVIPKTYSIEWRFRIERVYKVLYYTKKYNLYKHTWVNAHKVKFTFLQRDFYVNGDYFLDILTFFRKVGATKIHLCASEPNRAIVFKANNFLCLLMPLYHDPKEDTPVNERILHLSEWL